jgi:hypothetical protein
MDTTSDNCIICAEEFNTEELHNVKLSEINCTKFKICEACLNKSDPSNDYQEAKRVVTAYIELTNIKKIYSK